MIHCLVCCAYSPLATIMWSSCFLYDSYCEGILVQLSFQCHQVIEVFWYCLIHSPVKVIKHHFIWAVLYCLAAKQSQIITSPPPCLSVSVCCMWFLPSNILLDQSGQPTQFGLSSGWLNSQCAPMFFLDRRIIFLSTSFNQLFLLKLVIVLSWILISNMLSKDCMYFILVFSLCIAWSDLSKFAVTSTTTSLDNNLLTVECQHWIELDWTE